MDGKYNLTLRSMKRGINKPCIKTNDETLVDITCGFWTRIMSILEENGL